jgi:quercetin dioxygenase-like cupin family protein
MKVIADLAGREGWHLKQAGLPVQVGIKSGATPFSGPHRHRTMAEYFYLLEGELRLRVDAREVETKKGDLVVVEPGEAHQVVRASRDSLLLLLMPQDIPNDKVELEE